MAENAESFPTSFCHNLSAQRPPTAADDVSGGFRTGSIWIYKTGNQIWMCVDGTYQHAVWQNVSTGTAVWYKPL